MYCTIVYYIILYYTILDYAMRSYATLYCAMLYYTRHDGKHCQCAVTPGSPYFKSLNPGLLPATDAGGDRESTEVRDRAQV